MPEPSLLAQFLRSRREQLSPADVGLRDSGRRRTPGLRREEVATLAGISIDYLVRLEQGRDTNPSPTVLAALGQALQLDDEEHRHLLGLAAKSASPELKRFCPAAPALDAEVAPSVQLLLDQLDPTPAFLVGPLGDVVASNDAWRTLAAPLGLVEVPNLVRHVFLHPDARAIYPDWDDAADAQVARIRTAQFQLGEEPAFIALIDDLSTVDGFAERWSAHPVAGKRRGSKTLVHPEVGELHLTYEALGVGDDDQQLIAWLPADDATGAALRRALAGAVPVSPAHLRVIREA